VKWSPQAPSDLYMKKSLLFAVLLLGAATISQAGIQFGVEVGLPLPLPPLPNVVLSHTAPVYSAAPAPVCTTPTVYQAPACPPAQVKVYEPPVCTTPQVVACPTPAQVVVQPSRAYVEFSSTDYARPNSHYAIRGYDHREYAHDQSHFARQRSEHFREEHRW